MTSFSFCYFLILYFKASSSSCGLKQLILSVKKLIKLIKKEKVQSKDLIAIENLDEILEVENIDVFFVGPGDLSQELGHIGQQNHPEVKKVVQETINKITNKGKIAGTVANLSSYEWAMQTGAKFYLSGALDWISEVYDEFIEIAQKLDK